MMPTRFLALMLAFCAVSLLTIVGNAPAKAVPTPTAAATTVAALTDEATAEVTESVTAEATEPVLVGDPVRGEDIFRHGLNGVPPCVSCHNPTVAGRGGSFSIGPGLKGIGERGAMRVEGMTAPEYIEDSIRHPTNYIVGGYNPIMPPIFGEQYSDQTIADLVAFLMAA
jgi:mono/diheme cytochrome c family protein